MNGPTSPSGDKTRDTEAIRLAALIEENRVKIENGWEELRRLTEYLAELAAREARLHLSPAPPAGTAPVGSNSTQQHPIISKSE